MSGYIRQTTFAFDGRLKIKLHHDTNEIKHIYRLGRYYINTESIRLITHKNYWFYYRNYNSTWYKTKTWGFFNTISLQKARSNRKHFHRTLAGCITNITKKASQYIPLKDYRNAWLVVFS